MSPCDQQNLRRVIKGFFYLDLDNCFDQKVEHVLFGLEAATLGAKEHLFGGGVTTTSIATASVGPQPRWGTHEVHGAMHCTRV